MRNWLVQAFEYDLWALERWLDALESLGGNERAHPVIEHVLSAQRIWLTRIAASDIPATSLSIRDSARALNDCWRAEVGTRDLDETIAYRNSAGAAFQRTFGEIALHVVNHGTYHRGHLRGLFNDADLSLVPDTDLVYWLAWKDAAK